MKPKIFLAAALATLLFQTTSVLADLISGSISVSGADVTGSPSNSISTDTVFDLPNITASGTGTGDFSGVSDPQTLGSGVLTLATPTTFSFGTTEFGYFSALYIIPQTTGPLTEAFQIIGTFTPGTDEPGTTANTASLTISFTQNGGTGGVISSSGTLNTPTIVSLPEPASVILGFTAVIAGSLFHVVRRRKPTV